MTTNPSKRIEQNTDEEGNVHVQFSQTFELAKHPFGIDRRKYKGKGRPKESDYATGMMMSIGTNN